MVGDLQKIVGEIEVTECPTPKIDGGDLEEIVVNVMVTKIQTLKELLVSCFYITYIICKIWCFL